MARPSTTGPKKEDSERKATSMNSAQRINSKLCTLWSVEEILIFTDLQLDDFDSVNVITALYRIAKITSQSIGAGRATEVFGDVRFQGLLSRLEHWLLELDLSKPCDFRARGIANAAWSLAKLGYSLVDNRQLLHALVKAGEVHVAHA